MPFTLDLDIQLDQVGRLTSADAIAAFLHELGYPTGKRRGLAPAGLSLGETERAVTHAEVISEDEDGFLRVVFARLRSVTAKARADLVRAFARDAVTDHILILTSDFDTLEFVLIDKEQRQRRGVRREVATVARSRVFVVPRRWPHQSLRILRRLTYTMDDGLRQFDKLRSVFDAAHFSGTYFTNRALFADHYLETRLKEDQAWRADPGPAFQSVRRLVDAAPDRIGGKPLAEARQEFYEPLWSILGFRAAAARHPDDGVAPDYRLEDGAGRARTVALVYPWQRWLDGPDPNDPDRPDENPGAAVVSLLERGEAEWAIVTNGKHWRLYSRAAHSRSTNFYEVDLQDALLSSGLSDPNEAFRYWWLFFRLEALLPVAGDAGRVWLDAVAEGSRDYAREVEAELKRRVFYDVVPMLAQGFLHDRRRRLKKTAQPSEAELERIRHGTLTLLYRILFLLYAESRDLLPVREDPYYRVSLKKLKEEIAQVAGVAQSEADTKVDAHYSKVSTDLYDRLSDPKAGLFAAMASGRPAANVPRYNGGLFRLEPGEAADEHEADVCAFLNEHKVPDAFLAAAIDRLARVENPRTCTLEFVDYKSLGVRQLGSIYEGLLEFRLGVATEDLAVVRTKSKIEHIPLTRARGGRGRRRIEREYRKGEPLLIKDKAERKATGSYYTPDHIVEYIVEHTVGPVLKRKLEALRPEFRKAEKAFHRWLSNAEADPRIMLGWRPAWGPPPAGEGGKSTERDRRRFALEKSYNEHKGLVDRLFDLKVLDPAMGSGHFLVEAVDFITDELLDFLNAFPVNPVSAALERTREAILESLRGQGIETDEFLRRQLTDVHLLKRHVLKRCIYGVDLNPLATELAKVSLWLDAFTLGAPLSFLDHHLRTGNSLIGSSLVGLEKALEEQLFKIDESHLHRAVNAVLTVARLADATASEVAESKRAFDEARRTLSGYGVLLDILVARHFGHGTATSILQHGSDLDLSSREAFFESLTASDRRLVSAVDALAKDRRFFHWDLEFPEVFYTFAGLADGRVERLAEGEAGFDAIVGNPPYDELSEHAAGHELPELAFFRQVPLYKPAQGGRLNLFRLFMVRSLVLMAGQGQNAFIVPMSLLADTFPAGTRRLLLENGWLREVAAFPQKDDVHARVFFEAKLSTCIYRAEKTAEPDRPIEITTYPRHVFTDTPKRCRLTVAEVRALDPEYLALPAIDDSDLRRWRRILSSPRVTRWSDAATCYLGELMTNASNAHLTDPSPVGPRLLRGANINYYVLLDEPKQGTPLYLREREYLEEYANDPRSMHHTQERIGFQESSPIDNWRRLIACRIPVGHYCVHKIRYFTAPTAYDLHALLALFNSCMTDWRFALTSTNNSINAYEINALPIPRFERLAANDRPATQLKPWAALLRSGGPAKWLDSVVGEISQTPASAESWPDSVHDALAAAGREMASLAESRQARVEEFSDWLFQRLRGDGDRFTGITRLRGGQADFDAMDWGEFVDLLHRNRRAFRSDLDGQLTQVQGRFEREVEALSTDRQRFIDLRDAIDKVVWRLVGLNPDGSVPDAEQDHAGDADTHHRSRLGVG
ncbi:MAG: Eco57I restriction-modification methylase domain-containing protein [Phycisphaeraceae bacterium]|nr:Eco57I restriction-modification methylase domain-containing protein [Phycisphaeraceae bacterium]